MFDNTVEVETPLEEVEVEETEMESEEDTQDNTPETVQFAGREFNSMAEAEKAYKSMQADSTKAKQELARINKEIEKAQFTAEFQDLDADEKLNRLAELHFQKETVEEEIEENEEALEDDTPIVQAFVSKHPLLSEYPELADQFIEMALMPKYRDATLESLYKAKFEPLINKLAGKKVTVKRKIVGTPESGFTPEQIAAMDDKTYEKNRDAIHKQYQLT